MSETYDVPATTKGNNKSFTANPRAERGDDKYESTGPVTSDSLAQESLNSGGGFSDNPNPEVYSVRGANSTFTNTDTTNARRIAPADNREDRDGGRFETTSYSTGGDGSESRYRSNDDSSTSNQGYRSGNTADTDTGATYASTARGDNFSSGTYQPKGSNLSEDDSSVPPNRSTYTGDVGGPNDPGRQAEQKFARDNAISGSDAGYQRDTGAVNDGTKYDALNNNEQA